MKRIPHHIFHMSPVTEQDLKRPLPPELLAPITEPYDEQKDFEELYQLLHAGKIKSVDMADPEQRKRFMEYMAARGNR